MRANAGERGFEVADAQVDQNKSRLGPFHFDAWNELVLIMVGFMLTTAVGATINHWFQSDTDARARQTSQANLGLTQAKSTFDETSRVLDARLYATRAIIWARAGPYAKAERQRRQRAYQKTMDEWNINLNRNYAAVQTSFGCSARQELEGKISPVFISLSSAINSGAYPSGILIEKANDLNQKIYEFDLMMLDKMEKQEVSHGESIGSVAPRPNCLILRDRKEDIDMSMQFPGD